MYSAKLLKIYRDIRLVHFYTYSKTSHFGMVLCLTVFNPMRDDFPVRREV